MRVVATLALALVVSGCGGGAPAAPSVVTDLASRLRRAAEPGALTVEEVATLDGALAAVLPPLEGPLAGHRWEVRYVDLPRGDFVEVELLRGRGWKEERALWGQIALAPGGAGTLEGLPPIADPAWAGGGGTVYLTEQRGAWIVTLVGIAEALRSTAALQRVADAFDWQQLGG